MILSRSGPGSKLLTDLLWMKFYAQLFFPTVFLPIIACGQTENFGNLSSRLTQLFASPEFSKSEWSCCISHLSSGKNYYSFNADKLVIPASNQKLLTIAAALLLSGPTYKSKTHFLADGPIHRGELDGNLIISGYGAIHFTARYPASSCISEKSARLNEMLDRLAARFEKIGIRKIKGEILIDCHDWTDMLGNSHYPSAAPLSYHENTLDIVVERRAIFHCPDVLLGFQIQDRRWRGTQKKIVFKGDKTDRILVNSHRNSSDYWRLDQHSPLEYYKYHIRRALAQRGIVIEGLPIRPKKDKKDRYALFFLDSLPLGELLIDTGLYSDNFRAETIFLNLGYLVKGKANYENAQNALLSILSANGPMLNPIIPIDGSGLSRNNRISSSNMTKLLNFMLTTHHKDIFIRCLPVAGESGTLKNKLLNDTIRGQVIGKTGTLRDVTALSGYILKKSEPVLSFSFICNKSPGRKQSWRTIESALNLIVLQGEADSQ